MNSRDTERALAAAAAAQRAARAVAVDPSCEPAYAAHHLAAAWKALAAAVCPEEHVLMDMSDLQRWLPAGLQVAVGPQQVAALARSLPALLAEHNRTPSGGPGRADIEAHMRGLAALIAAAQGQLPARPWRRWLWLVVAALVLLVATQPWQRLTTPPWRGIYFMKKHHAGKSVIRHDAAIDFDWGKGSPMDELPINEFSVRWDTCMHIDEDTDVILQIISDDGTRVFVDGNLEILNRTKGQSQARGETVRMTRDVHHVRVEYNEYDGNAHVELLASFAGEPPGPIPAGLLSAPTGPIDAEDPCR